MPELTYGQSVAGITVPAGRYVCRFVGTEDRDPFQESRYGTSNEPRMAWVFEVIEGEKKGEKFAQETGRRASPKSSCARIILGLSGGRVEVGARVRTEDFIGRVYAVKIGPNPNSDKGNLYVADIEPVAGGQPPAGQATAPPPLPPRKSAPAGVPQPGLNDRYWIDTGADQPAETNTEGVRAFQFQKGIKAADLPLMRVGEAEWKTAKDYGFDDPAF